MTWRQDLETISSLGSTDSGVTRLADLHEARNRHLAQFFTPLKVVEIMWAIAQQSFHHRKDGKINLLDTSIGSARLMHFAGTDAFHIGGVDIHAEVVEQVTRAAEQHGISADIHCAGMQDIRPSGWDCGILNPPFSRNLESVTLKPYPCVNHGRLGPATAAQSDEYAIAQALDAASIVIAVVPQSLALDLQYRGADFVGDKHAKRLRAVLRLDGKAFLEEGANVNTCIVVYGHNEGRYLGAIEVKDLTQLPDFDLVLSEVARTPRLRLVSYDSSKPVIVMPVTGNKDVRVVHSGRKIGLKFSCGGIQARVMNAVYRKRVYSSEVHRLPNGIRYAGQGILDLQVILATDDPLATMEEFLTTIKNAGGEPMLDVGLLNRLKKMIRRKPRLTTPFGHWVYRAEHADKVIATAKCRVPSDPKFMMAPAVKAGETVELNRCEEGWSFTMKAWTRKLCLEEAMRLFDIPQVSSGWVEVHKPLQEHFPWMAKQLVKEAHALQLNRFLNWNFQFQDLIELCIRPTGSVAGWKQGLGKARLAAGLILLKRSKHGLVTMPACLLDEFSGRLRSAGLTDDMWKVIEKPSDLNQLRRINVISNERLRMSISSAIGETNEDDIEDESDQPGEIDPDVTEQSVSTRVKPKRSRNTYAKKLRGRIGVTVCDEGGFLANPHSEQSRAVAQVSAKTLFALDGTPIKNYCRNLLSLAVQTAGDGVVGQPYGDRHALLDPVNAKSTEHAERGVTEFAKRFCTFEWVTREFAENLGKGAKREVPKLQNVGIFRAWLSPFVKRRLQIEPEVRADVNIPVPTKSKITIDWDDRHLAMYLRVSDEFSSWYREHKGTPSGSNLITLLARIGAVEQAAAFPQRKRSGVEWSGGLTSHQRYLVKRCAELVKQGRKVVMFAEWPELLNLLAREINKEGAANAICYHGGLAKSKRRTNLAEFRYGKGEVLCASFGITQAGLDLYEADYVLFAHRRWTGTVEDQALFRLLRPQQTNPVNAEYVHIAGSIHEYQAQLVEWKDSSADAGLDWGTPMGDDIEFIHLDLIVDRFLNGLASLRGQTRDEFRKRIKEVV